MNDLVTIQVDLGRSSGTRVTIAVASLISWGHVLGADAWLIRELGDGQVHALDNIMHIIAQMNDTGSRSLRVIAARTST
jgi:hypothetical protein